MPYVAEISRRNPTAFVFLIDQSGSMAEMWEGGVSKAQAAADALNRLLEELITICSKEEGVRDYFHVGVVGYGWKSVDGLEHIGGSLLKPISKIYQSPKRVEERNKKVPDGAGGVIELKVKFPVWFDAKADGTTPMCEALKMAGTAVGTWADEHLSAFPPVVINITDGVATDGDPEPVADLIRQLKTDDGTVLLFNLHITKDGASKQVLFPAMESAAPDEHAKKLYRMSSEFPPVFLDAARSLGYSVYSGARGYGYNASFEALVHFLRIGTQAANTRLAR